MNDGNNSLDLLALTEEQKKEILKVVYEADTPTDYPVYVEEP